MVRREKAPAAQEMEQQAISALHLKGNVRKRQGARNHGTRRRRRPPWEKDSDRAKPTEEGQKTREERTTTRAVVIKRATKETRARLKEEEREDRKETKRMLKEAETKGPLDTEEAENQRRWRVKTRRSGKRKSEEE